MKGYEVVGKEPVRYFYLNATHNKQGHVQPAHIQQWQTNSHPWHLQRGTNLNLHALMHAHTHKPSYEL